MFLKDSNRLFFYIMKIMSFAVSDFKQAGPSLTHFWYSVLIIFHKSMYVHMSPWLGYSGLNLFVAQVVGRK